MNNNILEIKPTTKTPHIYFDQDSGILNISGRSTPENPYDFYAPVLDAISNFKSYASEPLTITIDFEYVNSGSAKLYVDFFKIISKIPYITVIWLYKEDDDDILDLGNTFKEFFGDFITVELKK